MDLIQQYPNETRPLLALILTEETTAPYVNENAVIDNQILPAVADWAAVAVPIDVMPDALMLLRCIIDSVYVLGIKDGLQRATNPIAKLFEKEDTI